MKYPPRPRGTTLRRFQVRSQRRPLNAAFDAHYASFVVEGDDTIQATRIDQHGVLGELLTSHGMSAAGDGNSLAGGPSSNQHVTQRVGGSRLDDFRNSRGVELRMNVVDQRSGLDVRDSGHVREAHFQGRCKTPGGRQRQRRHAGDHKRASRDSCIVHDSHFSGPARKSPESRPEKV